MNKKLLLRDFSGLLGILALSIVALGTSVPSLYAQAPAAAPPALPPTEANMKGKTAEQFYKKIEVLKGIPADQLHPAMEYITTALGVGCGYCHVVGHFDQDDKQEKHIARSMIQMTMALNNTVFDAKRELTCYTCHRGVARATPTMLLPGDKIPIEKSAREIFPPLAIKDFSNIDANMAPSKAPKTIMTGPPPAPAAPKPAAAPLPSVSEIFSKYEEGLGGKAAVDKITALNFIGTVDMMVPPPPGPPGTPPAPAALGTVPAEHDVKGMMGVISWIFPGRPKVAMGYDGNIAWHNTPIREDTGDEKRELVELGEKFPGLEFRDDHTNVQVDAMEKVGDRDTYRVVGTRKDGFQVIDRLNFDAQTGLLVKSYTTMQSVLGGFPEDTYYEDYRDVSGIKVPSTTRVVSAEGNQTFKWAQIDANMPADDAKFMKPAPPAPRPPAD